MQGAGEYKFVPSVVEIRGTCEAIYAPYLRQRERETRRDAQLADRLAPPPRKIQTREEFCQEMAARGLPTAGRISSTNNLIGALQGEVWHHDEQLAQVPDRQDSTWKKP